MSVTSTVNEGKTSYTVTSGSTNLLSAGQTSYYDVVSGVGSGGTNNPSTDTTGNASNGGGLIVSASVYSGGAVVAANYGTVSGGTAYSGGAFVAANQGVAYDTVIASSGILTVGMVSGYGGAGGQAIDPHVLAGGTAVVGGGFTAKGVTFSGAGVISGGTFDLGSVEDITSAGTNIGGLFGGTQILSAGGTSLSDIFSGGTQLISGVNGGGYASGSIVSSGGKVDVYSAGILSAGTAAAGGTIMVESGGIVRGDVILAGGTEIISSGGVASSVTISSGGVEIVSAGGTALSATISAGGTLSVVSGGTLGNTIVAGPVGSTTSNGTFYPIGTGGLLVVHSGAVLNNTSMGWKAGIDVEGVRYAEGDTVTFSGGTLTVANSVTGESWTTILTGSYDQDGFSIRGDVDGSTIVTYDKCFLAGTNILTIAGEVAVERLAVGDRIVDQGGEEREIVWIGRRAAKVRPGLSDDMAGYPVRIRQGAISENIPNKDLLITAEHAIFLDGSFVPARMLVNGGSIIYDKSFTSFDYFHVETDCHCALFSDGLLSESYLDTGERETFAGDGKVVRLVNAPVQSWKTDSFAPLNVTREFVEPIFRDIAARSSLLGFSLPEKSEVTNESGLHLIDDRGRKIRLSRKVGNSHIFMIPEKCQSVRIASRSSRPSDSIGPFIDDRRKLGVLVGSVRLFESSRTCELEAHLSNKNLHGWNTLESSGEKMRWTNGDAELPLGQRMPVSVGMLAIEIIAGGPYLLQEEESDNNISQAG
jgi:autotransporter passenger strand-loop-strand repeat protein